MFTIGCHLSIARGYTAAAEQAAEIGANAFQFFTRNPRGAHAKALVPDDVASFTAYRAGHGIDALLAHAPYVLNPASDKARTRALAREVLADDLERLETLGCGFYNMHPGSHVGQGVEKGIDEVAACLNEVLAPGQKTTLLLETMAGKGTELGRSFEEIAAIIDRVGLSDHVGVCLDTCHVWDAGYDIAHDLDGVLGEFDRVIGLERLKAVHLNDSKNPCGARKDRHEAIGEGHIGFAALVAVVNHPALRDLPFYLETPHDSPDGFAREIAMLKAARRS